MVSAAKKSKSSKLKSFELLMEEFEKIVSRLEDGDLSLDSSIELFEKGMKLAAAGMKKLDLAEKKVQALISEHGKERKVSFEAEDDSES